MSSHANRTPRGHYQSVATRLGHAAVIGGLERVMREITSDRFADTLKAAKDAETRRRILETAHNVAEKARSKPRAVTPPSPNERTKVRWTDEMVARFRKLAPRIKDDAALAVALGLPSYCVGSMKRARTRYLPRVVATGTPPGKRLGGPLAPEMAKAA